MKEFIDKLIGRLEDRIKYNELCHEEFPNAKMSLTYEVQINAYKNAISIVNQLAEEYKSRIIIDEQYCWQTCACTEKCNQCRRLSGNDTYVDWYEDIENWAEEYDQTIDVAELLEKFGEKKVQSNADYIRNMTDEELAEHFSELIRDTRRNEYLTGVGDWLLWLQSEAE